MVYTVDQLINDFRSDVFDKGAVGADGATIDTLWSTEDVLRYANFAAAQWAKDTLAIRRNVDFNVVADKSRYYVGQEIIEIVLARFIPEGGGYGRKLSQFSLNEGVLRDDYGVQYLSVNDIEPRKGPPRGITLDYDPTYLRVYPTPDVDGGTLKLNLVLYPPELQLGMPMPSASFRDRPLFLLWMKNLAYRKQDADVLDLDRAESYKREYFEAVFDRMAELDREQRHDPVMKSRW